MRISSSVLSVCHFIFTSILFDYSFAAEKIATFVYETDENYRIPTCTSIVSMCETTKATKNIVIIQDGSISQDDVNNIENIGGMYDETSIIVRKIPEHLEKKIEEADMGIWSKMVAVRLFYPEIFSFFMKITTLLVS